MSLFTYEKKWMMDQLINLRNEIEHRTLPKPFEEDTSLLSPLKKRSKNTIEKYFEFWKGEGISINSKEIDSTYLDELFDISYVLELGKSCCRFISLVDSILYLYSEQVSQKKEDKSGTNPD